MSSHETLSTIIVALELQLNTCKSLNDQIHCLQDEQCQVFNVVIFHCRGHDHPDYLACLENCQSVLAGIIQKLEYTREQLQEHVADLKRAFVWDLVSGGPGGIGA